MRARTKKNAKQSRPSKERDGSETRRTASARSWHTRFAIQLFVIGLLALALRLIALAELSGTPLFALLLGDAKEYDSWTQQIVTGDLIGTGIFYQTPLYRYLMAAVFAVFGHHVFIIRVLQCVCSAGACTLLGLGGRYFFSARAGLMAAFLMAIYPPAIFFDLLIQKASLDGALMTLIILALGAFLICSRARWLLVLGVTLGLLILNRENSRVLYPIFITWLLFGFRQFSLRRRAAWASIVTASVLLVLAPVAIRNYHLGGELFLSTSQLGPNLYIGNHANASGTYEPLVPEHGNAEFERTDATQLAEAATNRKLSPGEVSDYWLSQAFAYIRSQPMDWGKLMLRKLALTFNRREAVDTESIEAYVEYSYVLRILFWMSFGVVFPLGVLGVWITRHDWRRLVVLYAMVAGFGASVVLFYVMARYRYPIAPMIMLFAGLSVSRIGDLKRDSIRRWMPGLILAVIVAVLSNLPLKLDRDNTKVYVGSELIRNGRPEEAVPLLRQAVAELPDYAPAHFSLALALDQTGESNSALTEYEMAVRLWPDDFRAQGALALALEEAGQPEAALDHFREASRLRPDSAAAQNNLAIALHKANKAVEAIPFYEAALALKPDYVEAHTNLALALATAGQTDRAVTHFQQALQLQPDNVAIHVNFGDALMEIDRIPEAIAQYQQAVSLAPQSPDTHARLAQAYQRSGRLREALERFNIAIEMARSAGQTESIQQLLESAKECEARLGRSAH